MSVAEMKLAAINEVGKLNDENAVKEILEHFQKIRKDNLPKTDTDDIYMKNLEKFDLAMQKILVK